jgi:hypothetical protein
VVRKDVRVRQSSRARDGTVNTRHLSSRIGGSAPHGFRGRAIAQLQRAEAFSLDSYYPHTSNQSPVEAMLISLRIESNQRVLKWLSHFEKCRKRFSLLTQARFCIPRAFLNFQGRVERVWRDNTNLSNIAVKSVVDV